MCRRFVPALALVFALVIAACGGAAPAPTAPVPSNTPTELIDETPELAGAYSAPHVVMMVCEGGDDGWCEESVADSMTIAEVGGDLDVAIELVQTNGHTCGFEGRLALAPRAATRRWTFHSEDPDEGSCTLMLEQADTELRLSSDGCRHYCGARASLDATFPFPAR